TTRWLRNAAPSRATSPAAAAASVNARTPEAGQEEFGVDNDAAAKAHEVPQAVQGPHPRCVEGRHGSEFRRVRPEGPGTQSRHGARDRGGAPRDHPSDEAPGPRLDPRLP